VFLQPCSSGTPPSRCGTCRTARPATVADAVVCTCVHVPALLQRGASHPDPWRTGPYLFHKTTLITGVCSTSGQLHEPNLSCTACVCPIDPLEVRTQVVGLPLLLSRESRRRFAVRSVNLEFSTWPRFGPPQDAPAPATPASCAQCHQHFPDPRLAASPRASRPMATIMRMSCSRSSRLR